MNSPLSRSFRGGHRSSRDSARQPVTRSSSAELLDEDDDDFRLDFGIDAIQPMLRRRHRPAAVRRDTASPDRSMWPSRVLRGRGRRCADPNCCVRQPAWSGVQNALGYRVASHGRVSPGSADRCCLDRRPPPTTTGYRTLQHAPRSWSASARGWVWKWPTRCSGKQTAPALTRRRRGSSPRRRHPDWWHRRRCRRPPLRRRSSLAGRSHIRRRAGPARPPPGCRERTGAVADSTHKTFDRPTETPARSRRCPVPRRQRALGSWEKSPRHRRPPARTRPEQPPADDTRARLPQPTPNFARRTASSSTPRASIMYRNIARRTSASTAFATPGDPGESAPFASAASPPPRGFAVRWP